MEIWNCAFSKQLNYGGTYNLRLGTNGNKSECLPLLPFIFSRKGFQIFYNRIEY